MDLDSVSRCIALLRLAAGQNANNWQPCVIPRNRLPFRHAKTVPSKVWDFDAGSEKRHLSVHFRDVSSATGF
jgi:hypothetical protein